MHYKVIEASNGLEALELLERTKDGLPDLIITDVLMPKMDGYELVRRLRSDLRLKNMPVIFLTGTFSGFAETALSKSGGVASHLIKPVAPEGLRRAILEALENKPNEDHGISRSYEQEHLQLLTNHLSSKVEELEKTNNELRQEVHKRRQAESEALEAKNNLAAISDSIPQLSWQILKSGQLRYVNLRWRQFHNCWESPLWLKNWSAFFHPDERENLVQLIRDSLASNKNFSHEAYLLKLPERVYVPHWISALVIPNSWSSEPSWFGTCTDISSQKEYEQQLIRLKEQAESLSRAKSEFLNNVSHELRTPLTAILGFSEILQEEELGSAQDAFVDRIHSGAKRLVHIMSDIISISELEAGDQNSHPEMFSLEKLLRRLRQEVGDLAAGKGLQFKLLLPPDLKDNLKSHPEVIRRILSHLMENAIKFTDAGYIQLKVSVQKRRSEMACLVFDVEDTGVGIAFKFQSSLFQPFSQADSSVTRLHGGLGLGLILSRRLAQSIGGSLELIRSTPGVGSSFRLKVPLSYSENPTETAWSQAN